MPIITCLAPQLFAIIVLLVLTQDLVYHIGQSLGVNAQRPEAISSLQENEWGSLQIEIEGNQAIDLAQGFLVRLIESSELDRNINPRSRLQITIQTIDARKKLGS